MAYRLDPWLFDRGNRMGRQLPFFLKLAGSRIFRGDDPTLEPGRKSVRKERQIFVCVPAAYRNGDRAPILVIHDGPGQLDLVWNALDNLTGSPFPARRLPALLGKRYAVHP